MHEQPDHTNCPGQTELLLDRPVPPFRARSTHGDISLQDYRGQWLILFSHPADFTPVCTSELIALERSIDEFKSRDCALLGLSVDSIYSHVAWATNIREKFNVQISFPIIEDISMSISRAYGMLDESSNSTATVRSVFFIDPEGILRAKIYYPMQVGRNIAEVIRTLSALQAADEHQMTTPEGWIPGDTLIPMAPTTVDHANEILSLPENTEWYYTDVRSIN